MEEIIGSIAGKLWQTLGQKGEISTAMLPKQVGQKSDVVYQALGWLAREGKIIYKKKGDKSFVSLNSSELENFKRTIH